MDETVKVKRWERAAAQQAEGGKACCAILGSPCCKCLQISPIWEVYLLVTDVNQNYDIDKRIEMSMSRCGIRIGSGTYLTRKKSVDGSKSVCTGHRFAPFLLMTVNPGP